MNTEAVDRSCRWPLLLLFVAAAWWLLVGSCFGLAASIKFHGPNFLSGTAWLTYGRLQPVASNLMLYGFCLQAGLGVALWTLARLGSTRLSGSTLVFFGLFLLNIGLLLGIAAILWGDSTGFENLEIPGYASPLIFLGYLLISVAAAVTFHHRAPGVLAPSQWFLLAAFFWFAWIYCTAQLLLVSFPVRGIAQAVIAWWYSQNFLEVWLGLTGLATILYLVPLMSGQPTRSHYLALFVFWLLILFGSWSCIPGSAPVPAWMPALSSAARIVNLTLFIGVALLIFGSGSTLALVRFSHPRLSFVWFGAGAFVLAGLLAVAGDFWDPVQLLNFSWFSRGRAHVQIYGFFVMVMFGAMYYIVPRVADMVLPWPRLERFHFFLAALGIIFFTLPLLVGGIIQAVKMQNASIPFVDVARSALMFIRISTLGELLLVLGHLFLLLNLAAVIRRLARVSYQRAYSAATENLFKTAEAKG